jgi:hypothetical protein
VDRTEVDLSRPPDQDRESAPQGWGTATWIVVQLWSAPVSISSSDGLRPAGVVQDPALPFFTTRHFDGHASVLVRASRIDELDRQELAEIIEDAWLARASARRGEAWLKSRASQ